MGTKLGFILTVFFLFHAKAQNIEIPHHDRTFWNTSTNDTTDIGTTPLEQMTPISDTTSSPENTTEDVSSGRVASSSGNNPIRSCLLYKFIISVVLIGSLCVAGVIGNFLAVIVLVNYDSSASKSSTPLLLGALAVSDMLVLLTVFMMKTVPSFCDFTQYCGRFMTDVFPYWLVYGWPSVDLTHAYSTFITLVVTLHRYIAVCRPHKAKSFCTRKHGLWHLIAVIVFCTLFEMPVFLDFHLELYFDNETNTTQLLRVYSALGNDETYRLIYKAIAYYTILYLIPFLILTILTGLLVRALSQSRAMQSEMNPQRGGKSDDITRILVVLVLVFMACQPWEPVRRILEHYYGFQGCGHVYYYYEEFPSLSFAINSAANFIIYCLLGSKFRALLRRKCGCKSLETRFDDSSSQNLSHSTKVGDEHDHVNTAYLADGGVV